MYIRVIILTVGWKSSRELDTGERTLGGDETLRGAGIQDLPILEQEFAEGTEGGICRSS